MSGDFSYEKEIFWDDRELPHSKECGFQIPDIKKLKTIRKITKMKLDKRRRMECKTNYTKRLRLLEGNSPRLVIRKTNKYITLQIIESKNAQDKAIYSASSRELLKHGWPKEKQGSLKSLPAAYLAGSLLGKKAGKIKKLPNLLSSGNFSLSKSATASSRVSNPDLEIKGRLIVDTGLIPNTKGSRIYAAIKGAADSGLEINYNKEIMPSQERIEGKTQKLDEIFNKIKGGLK